MKPSINSDAAFLLLYYDDEILKPSNTGKLIADLFPDTFAYIWKRTEVDPELIALLEDPQWAPVVIFPKAYATQGRVVYEDQLPLRTEQRPLFILLDGSWREAKKMFRKSPYLDKYPVLSVNPERQSRYIVRKAARDHQLATAEVAAMVVKTFGETFNGEVLENWLDVFSYRYQKGVMRVNQGDETAEMRLADLLRRQPSK